MDKRVEKETVEGKKSSPIPNEETADTIVEKLKNANYKVAIVEKKEKKRNPVPPFITSTLQQEASRHYGFSASRTMNIAQGLYEGIDLGNEGTEGLDHLHAYRLCPYRSRSDRRRAHYIAKTYGKEYLPAAGHTVSRPKKAPKMPTKRSVRPTFNTIPKKSRIL